MTKRAKFALIFLLVLSAWVGWQIYHWGQPIPPAYERLGPGRYRAVGGEDTSYVAEDTNGDRTVDRVYPEGAPERGFRRPAADQPDTRWLILCLDGVPYEEMEALWEQGYFREFFAPSQLIAPFPSDSETALTDVFHADPVPGYEHLYFSRTENRLRGGVRATLQPERIPYLERLDYDMSGLFKGLAYVLPRKSYRADLGRFRRHFLESKQKVFLAHIASVDSLYHILSREEMRALLVEVDSLLRELYYASAGRLRLTLFSDHGNSLVPSQPVRLRAFLRERGWQLTDRLEGPRDVVVPAYGLVGFIAVYCQPGSVAELAHTLTEIEGVDFTVWRNGGGVVIESRRGRAQLESTKQGQLLRYRPERQDPLGLAPLLAEELRSNRTAAGGYVPGDDLFAATAQHRYPDAADRIRLWADNHVQNRADILVSLEPGYHHGSPTFEHIVTLRSTHGSLDRDQSLGFAMSTAGPLPAVLRSRELLPENLIRQRQSPAQAVRD